jgi:hypothetical protein
MPITLNGTTGIVSPSVTGTPVIGGLVSGTAVASTSGTSIDFTSIPSWVKRITVMFSGVSTNGSSQNIIQTGAGSIVTSGYASYHAVVVGGASSATAVTTSGFGLWNGNGAEVRYIIATLANISGNTWVCSHSGGLVNGANYYGLTGGGSVTLSGTLDRIRITTVNGTDTFDAGTINIMYEG